MVESQMIYAMWIKGITKKYLLYDSISIKSKYRQKEPIVKDNQIVVADDGGYILSSWFGWWLQEYIQLSKLIKLNKVSWILLCVNYALIKNRILALLHHGGVIWFLELPFLLSLSFLFINEGRWELFQFLYVVILFIFLIV